MSHARAGRHEIDARTTVTLCGLPLDEPLVRHGPFFTAQFYTPDQLGSTTSLTDAAGNLGQQYQYGPFGEAAQSPTPGNPFQFAGRERDQSDPRSLDFKQTGLYFNRNRYYAPQWGRFISEDPIGFAGGINQYAYVENDPLGWVDPFGLEPWWNFKIPLSMKVAEGARTAVMLADIWGVARSAELLRGNEFFTQRPAKMTLEELALSGLGMRVVGEGRTSCLGTLEEFPREGWRGKSAPEKAFKHYKSKFRLDPHKASDILHDLKEGLRNNEDLWFGKDGTLWRLNPIREYLGSFLD
jgi:RHS repeat-associated protein